jgi:hypothetical protein
MLTGQACTNGNGGNASVSLFVDSNLADHLEPPMSFHPAYPFAADLSREAAGIQRDLADQATLRELRRIVLRAIAALSPTSAGPPATCKRSWKARWPTSTTPPR